MKRQQGRSRGFTLLEMLIVVSLFATVGTMAIIVLVTTLRTSTKTNIINVMKENGDFAITQMTTQIRYAKNIICNPPTSITIIALDNSQKIYSCAGNTIQLNNASSMFDITSVSLVPNTCSITCSQPNVTDNPLVFIQFTLQRVGGSNLVEQTAPPIQFNTTVSMRNINR